MVHGIDDNGSSTGRRAPADAPTSASSGRLPVRMALQGGGAYGAYTAGALDALLASRRLELTQFSGTSAGAINAAITASALVRGGRRAARDALAAFWRDIAAGPLDGGVGWLLGAAGRAWTRGVGEWLLHGATALRAPHGPNPLPSPASTPLKAAIERHVDFDALRDPRAPAVFVTLTHVGSGLPRVLGNDEITIDVILASACLPQYFRAVQIDGEDYWDGGFTGNPTLWPLIRQAGEADVILVQLSPEARSDTPEKSSAIRQRIAEIVFHSSLVAEMQAVLAMRDVARRTGQANRFSEARFHRIGPPPTPLADVGSASDRSPAFLKALAEAGRDDARRFLVRHGDAIGRRDTLPVAGTFLASHKTRLVSPRQPPGADGREPALRHGIAPPVASE